MDRLDNDYQERDQGLLKIIRNISYWSFKQQQLLLQKATLIAINDNNNNNNNNQNEVVINEKDYKYRGIWSPHFKLLLELLTDTDDHDILVELLGILANMSTFDVSLSFLSCLTLFCFVLLCFALPCFTLPFLFVLAGL